MLMRTSSTESQRQFVTLQIYVYRRPNIDNRVEVACPIYDLDLQKQLLDTFLISWNDNVKARILNGKDQNVFKKTNAKPYRSQWEMYEYFKAQLAGWK